MTSNKGFKKTFTEEVSFELDNVYNEVFERAKKKADN